MNWDFFYILYTLYHLNIYFFFNEKLNIVAPLVWAPHRTKTNKKVSLSQWGRASHRGWSSFREEGLLTEKPGQSLWGRASHSEARPLRDDGPPSERQGFLQRGRAYFRKAKSSKESQGLSKRDLASLWEAWVSHNQAQASHTERLGLS